jgi:hypothetical protein
MFDQYYTRQQKGGDVEFPVYIGRASQQGHGLGNILGSLLRKILPMFKAFAPHALRGAANFVEDMSRGKSWKESAVNRVPETLNAYVLRQKAQSGSGGHRRRIKRKQIKRKRSAQKSRKRARRDIFSK